MRGFNFLAGYECVNFFALSTSIPMAMCIFDGPHAMPVVILWGFGSCIVAPHVGGCFSQCTLQARFVELATASLWFHTFTTQGLHV